MNDKNGNGGGIGGFIAIIILVALCLSMCSSSGSSRSSSSRKWSDLSETEKNNARWAYYAKQEIDKRR